MAIATRTVNPLHFEDLEPHRFEDLVRQLIYDLRPWKSLEAVGRSGSDEGIDIRATEAITDHFATWVEVEEPQEDQPIEAEATERVWLIQCKRERSLAPKKIAKIVEDNLKNSAPKPAVYMLVAACDFSKAARDSFRNNAVEQGVEEFYLWGKAELEDLLFQPKNDHLLFAYFGISLQVKKRALKTQFRANYLMKKKIRSVLGERQELHVSVMLRDAESNYPQIGDVATFLQNPGWRYFEYFGPLHPDAVTFRTRVYLCYTDWKNREFDFLNFDVGWPYHIKLHGIGHDSHPNNKLAPFWHYPLRMIWQDITPDENQSQLEVLNGVPYDRILLLDDIGDHNPGPHLIVQCPSPGQFFEGGIYPIMKSAKHNGAKEVMKAWKHINYYSDFKPQLSEILREWPDLLSITPILSQIIADQELSG